MKEHIFDIVIIAAALIYALLRVITKNKKNAAKAKSVIAQRDATVGEQPNPATVTARPASPQQPARESSNPWDVFKRVLEQEDQEWDVFKRILKQEDKEMNPPMPEFVEAELAMETSMPMEEGGRTTITKSDWKFDDDEIREQEGTSARQLSFADYKRIEAEQKTAMDSSKKNYFDDDMEEAYNDITNDFNLGAAVLYSEILNPKY